MDNFPKMILMFFYNAYDCALQYTIINIHIYYAK